MPFLEGAEAENREPGASEKKGNGSPTLGFSYEIYWCQFVLLYAGIQNHFCVNSFIKVKFNNIILKFNKNDEKKDDVAIFNIYFQLLSYVKILQNFLQTIHGFVNRYFIIDQQVVRQFV